jgi:hypothetical protein
MTAKKRRLSITDRALDIFDAMETLVRDTRPPEGADADAWWEQNIKLCRELGLRPWEFPAYADYDDSGCFDRYVALKAASDARKRA